MLRHKATARIRTAQPKYIYKEICDQHKNIQNHIILDILHLFRIIIVGVAATVFVNPPGGGTEIFFAMNREDGAGMENGTQLLITFLW